MSLLYSFDSLKINNAVYKKYLENKLCFICIKESPAFVDNTATDETQRTVIGKLKFICKDYKKNMFPPSDVALNICYRCDCNISVIYNAKQKIVGGLNHWQKYFNLTQYEPSTNDTYKTCSKMETDEKTYLKNISTKTIEPPEIETPTTEIAEIENVYIEEIPVPSTSTSTSTCTSTSTRTCASICASTCTSSSTCTSTCASTCASTCSSNDIVNDLKGFLHFKDIPSTSTSYFAYTPILIKEEIEEEEMEEIEEEKMEEMEEEKMEELEEVKQEENIEVIMEVIQEELIELKQEEVTEEMINEYTSTSNATFTPSFEIIEATASTSYARLIPVNIIANCSNETVTSLNIINPGEFPESSEVKFVNVSTIPGRKTIFNQVDPSLFIKDTVNNLFLCLKCNRQFAELRYLSRHLKLHCDEQDGLYPCTECNRKFLTQSYLDKHMYCHSADAAFKCDHCNLGFATELLLDRHMLCHSKVKKYFCEVCKRGYRMRYELTMHMEVHAGKTFPCTICNKTFATQRLFDKHHKRHQNPTPATKFYTCEVCGAELRSQTSLKTHLRKHNGTKFQCAHCEKFYYNQTQLNLHLCKHNNDRKFACPVCDKKFYTAQILENHSYSHSEERNFVCEFCGKTYTMKSALYIHSREHAPFKCKICKKGFWKARNLTAHVNRVHDGETEPDDTTECCSDDSSSDYTDDGNNSNPIHKLVIDEHISGDDEDVETNMNID